MSTTEQDAFDARVLEAVQAGCAMNAEIRERLGFAGYDGLKEVGEALQRLKASGQVVCKGMRWATTSMVNYLIEVPRDERERLLEWLRVKGGRVVR